MPREIEVKSILNKTKRQDPWFLDDYTVNLYSSCSFNCLYCYIRGSKYGTNLETSLSVKANAIEVLDKQLANRAKKGQYGIIVLSSATDPYLQIEERYELTRAALEVILKHRFPVHMLTKSHLITRDLDLLHQIDQTAILPDNLKDDLQHGVIVSFSFSTVDDKIGKIFESGATPPSRRLETMKQVIDKDFLCGVSMMPMIPFVSDTAEHLELMFSTFKSIGADYVLPATITLFGNEKADSKTLMLHAISKHYPELLERYHKYFDNSHELPKYYRDAFYKKMQELGDKYQLEYRIRQAAINKRR